MRIVKKIILPVLLCAALQSEAQQIDRSVVATAGSIRTAGGITVSHTIGENVVMLKQAGSLQMRQGFQQSAKKDGVGVRVLPITHLSASPNPFTTELKGRPSIRSGSFRWMVERFWNVPIRIVTWLQFQLRILPKGSTQLKCH